MQFPRRSRCPAALLLIAALPALAATPILVSSRSPELAPAITGSGPSSGGVFVGPPTDAGNRYVVFLSGAGDLVDPPLPVGGVNVFRRDRVERRTELLSLTSDGGAGVRPVLGFSVTPDGERMAFAWASQDGPAGDTNAWEDVYLREVSPGMTRLVSVRADGSGPGNGPSAAPEISADGRFVVFESLATDLVSVEDTNRVEDVFLRNLEAGTTELLSATPAGIAGDRPSREPLISADGTRVVFRSESTILAPLVGHGTELLVWNRGSGGLTRVVVSGSPGSAPRVPLTVAGPTLSADGRHLAFHVPSVGGSSVLDSSGIWWVNLDTGEAVRASGTLAVAGGSIPEVPSLSSNGGVLAFTAMIGNSQFSRNRVRIWTLEGGLRTLEELRVTVPPIAGEPAVTHQPVLAPDGASLLFLSDEAVPAAGVPEGGKARLYHRVLATGATRLIADEEVAFAGEISADGNAVLWDTADPVLEPGDDNLTLDVMITRLADGGREVASLVAPSQGPISGQGISMGGSGISDDGRLFAFMSTAEDLVAGDTNGVPDGFLFDGSGIRRVTGPPEGSDLTARAKELVLSRSGRFAAFVTASRGWTDGDTNELADVYVSDLELGITELASVEDGTESSLNLSVDEVRLSGDGRWVSFRGIPSQGPASSGVLYLRDRVARRTTLVNSTARTGHSMQLRSGHELSTDGQVLLFMNLSRRWIHRVGHADLIPVDPASLTQAWLSPSGVHMVFEASIDGAAGLWVRPMEGGGERLLLPAPLHFVRDVMFSADGTVLTYCRRSDPAGPSVGNPWQVWALAVATGDEDLISRSPAGAHGSADSREPQISADGRFIVYRTEASNLVPDGGGMTQDIVVHDRYLGVNRRLSATPDGGPGNNRSSRPEISGDGRVAAFSSAASDLVRGDGNGLEDVFLVAIPRDLAPDEDRDGLPDGWEDDRFGSQSRDGSGDADGDGFSDAAEWSAGTDPKEAASYWQIGSEFIGGAWQLRWKGAAGVQYQVERSDALSAGTWAPVGGPLAGYEGMMSSPIGEEASAGFFRVAAVRP